MKEKHFQLLYEFEQKGVSREKPIACIAMLIFPDIFKRIEWKEDYTDDYEIWRDVLYRYKSIRLRRVQRESSFSALLNYLLNTGTFLKFVESDKTLSRYGELYLKQIEILRQGCSS